MLVTSGIRVVCFLHSITLDSIPWADFTECKEEHKNCKGCKEIVPGKEVLPVCQYPHPEATMLFRETQAPPTCHFASTLPPQPQLAPSHFQDDDDNVASPSLLEQSPAYHEFSACLNYHSHWHSWHSTGTPHNCLFLIPSWLWQAHWCAGMTKAKTP